ncbi:MAG TPA: glycosyl hydrolase, partial [Verrucomicrobiales bacterium]|nr:glycosyl hydrolase [Verrucomicrobiales bacterium]
EDADLLRASSWTSSNPVARDPSWLEGKFGGWLEGNAVAAPDGAMLAVLRVDYRTPFEKAALLHIDPTGRVATFNPATDFVEFPGGCKKFTLRRDPAGPAYWALANHVPEDQRGYSADRTRNTLALLRSVDLRHWEVRALLLQHPDRFRHGFHYVDWLFEGQDIVALARTAFDDGEGGAPNQHDANYLTFHRFRNFRALSLPTSLPQR